MANLHKFVVTDKVSGLVEVAGKLYEAGDEIYLPEHQANHYNKSSYLINGLLKYLGEAEPEDTSMDSVFMDLYDAKLNTQKNILPVASIKLATNLVKAVNPFGVQAADSAGGYVASRRLYVSKVGVKFLAGTSVAGAPVRGPWYLVTAGDTTLVDPTLLMAYDDTAGTYTAATNGAVAVNAPIVWAADDMLIIGYSEKFSSVGCDMTTANSHATAIKAYYWTAEGWKEFVDENDDAITVDYTAEVATKTLSRAAALDKTRIVWWTKPTDWVAGGPNGSGANNATYCIAIKFDGVLTDLAGGAFYPILDTPIADVNLGSQSYTTSDYFTYKAGTWSNTFDIDGWGAANDAIYVATDNLWDSLYVDMSANVNAAATAISFSYWNGVGWQTLTCTDGTAAVLGTPFAQDGWITITSPLHPVDWKKCNGSEINTNLTTSADYYWFRILRTGGGTTTATTAVTSVESNNPAAGVWHYFDAKNDGFVNDSDPIKFVCMLENADVDAVEIMAVTSDI